MTCNKWPVECDLCFRPAGMQAPDHKFSIFFPNIHTVHTNFICGMLIHTFHAEQLGIIIAIFLLQQQEEIIFFDSIPMTVIVIFA